MKKSSQSRGGIVGLLAGVFSFCALPTVGHTTDFVETRPSEYTTAKLKDRLTAAHSNIRAFCIEYEISAANRDTANPSTVRRIVAAKAPGMFFHDSSHYTNFYTWEDDPYRLIYKLQGGDAISYFPFQRKYRVGTLERGSPLPGSYPTEILFFVLGWWPLSEVGPPRRNSVDPMVIPEVAHSDEYIVRSLQERVDGRWCHVLERVGSDTLWLDVERNCIPLAREWRASETNKVIQRIELGDIQERAPGIWAPGKFRNLVFSPDKEQPAMDARGRLLDVKLNDQVPDSVFSCVPEAGSIRVNEDGSFEQTVSGSDEFLNKLVDWVKRHPQEGVTVETNALTASGVEAAVEYCFIATSIIAIFILYRNFQRKGTTRTLHKL